ncbi:MAG: cytochrome c [Planctomycetes bacterium]|nr:cytochrome c [Planctomycetota bacterium]
MSNRTAFWIFILGTASSALLFIFLTVDMHRQVDALTNADKLTDDVVAGKKVWEKYNCNDCHTLLGFGGYYAPDMTKVYKRRGEDGIRFIVKEPEKAFAKSWRKMPKQNLSDAEINSLIAFLKWVSEINNGDWPPQDSDKRIANSALKLTAGAGVNLGMALLQDKGCLSCHNYKGVGDEDVPLEKAGEKYDAETLKKLIHNPQSVNKDASMPPQDGLSDAELETIVNFLKSKN